MAVNRMFKFSIYIAFQNLRVTEIIPWNVKQYVDFYILLLITLYMISAMLVFFNDFIYLFSKNYLFIWEVELQRERQR